MSTEKIVESADRVARQYHKRSLSSNGVDQMIDIAISDAFRDFAILLRAYFEESQKQ